MYKKSAAERLVYTSDVSVVIVAAIVRKPNFLILTITIYDALTTALRSTFFDSHRVLTLLTTTITIAITPLYDVTSVN